LAEVQRMQQTLEAAQRDLSNQVYEQFSAMTEGVLRIAALEQAVRSAQQALLSSQKSLQAGARTTVDVLNAEQQLTVAQRDLAQARYGYVLAHLKLQMLAGQERMANVDAVNRWLKTQG
jgi:outer membrane protein/protease secretion system outer membrane protein